MFVKNNFKIVNTYINRIVCITYKGRNHSYITRDVSNRENLMDKESNCWYM